MLALVLAGALTRLEGEQPSEPGPSDVASADLALYRHNPAPEQPAAVEAALAAADREIQRLEEANSRRSGGVREANQRRIDDIKRRRDELRSDFSEAGWDALLRAAFGALEVDRLAAADLDDATLWNLSQNKAFVEAGKATVAFNCVPCHLPSLRGKTESGEAFAPDLTDTWWIHGGRPSEVYAFITHGAPTKGMPGWGALIGAKKVAEVAAYVLSKHTEGEPIHEQPGNVPVAATE